MISVRATISIVLSLSFLSGCATLDSRGGPMLQPAHAFQYSETNEPTIAFQYIRPPDKREKQDLKENQPITLPRSYDILYSRTYDAVHSPEDEKAIQRFVEAAISYSNLQCKLWFDDLVKFSVKLSREQGNMNVVGNLITTLLGVFEASSRGIAAFAAGQAAANSVVDNERSLYLLIDIEQTQKKIDDLRFKLVHSPGGLTSRKFLRFDDAKLHILEYDKTCSRQEVKRLLSKGLDFAEYDVDPMKALSQQEFQTYEQLKQVLTTEMAEALNDQEVVLLYATVFNKNTPLNKLTSVDSNWTEVNTLISRINSLSTKVKEKNNTNLIQTQYKHPILEQLVSRTLDTLTKKADEVSANWSKLDSDRQALKTKKTALATAMKQASLSTPLASSLSNVGISEESICNEAKNADEASLGNLSSQLKELKSACATYAEQKDKLAQFKDDFTKAYLAIKFEPQAIMGYQIVKKKDK